MYDCIVVGAGPAGGAAAYHLAKRGVSVLVLEKELLPRYKPCGGGVSPQVAQWFDFDFSPAISIKTTTIQYTWNMDDPVVVDMDDIEPIWMVRRDVFDHFLVQQAQRQGAELQMNTAVTGIEFKGDRWHVNTTHGSVEAHYLIAADGAKGPMARWLGFKQRKRTLAGALEIETPATDAHAAFFEFGMVQNGYIWNFPKADGYSLGIGTFQSGGKKKQDFKAILAQYATMFGVDWADVTQQHGHPICLWNGHQDLHTQQAVLAGDTACVVDPFTAEGIRPSIFTGIKAADAIHGALGGDTQALERYSQIVQEELGQDFVWAKRLADVFYRVPQVAYKVGVKQSSGTKRMVRLLSGELRYRDVIHRAIAKLGGNVIPGLG
ncbi:MAG: geranylgeranyl reductase family protein [Merismopedia sp. SIO2A8]|nr:geranylgeranyl reductase family protein [Merismopedia sp. SIO2A8]